MTFSSWAPYASWYPFNLINLSLLSIIVFRSVIVSLRNLVNFSVFALSSFYIPVSITLIIYTDLFTYDISLIKYCRGEVFRFCRGEVFCCCRSEVFYCFRRLMGLFSLMGFVAAAVEPWRSPGWIGSDLPASELDTEELWSLVVSSDHFRFLVLDLDISDKELALSSKML